ncbi:MAG: hypothetical protein ACM32O_06515 [Clostridia bacterium]
MGSNFNSYIGHCSSEKEIKELLCELKKERLPLIAQFLDELVSFDQNCSEDWRMVKDMETETIRLIGPCGLEFLFSKKLCVISHYTRWRTFLLNDAEEIDFQKQFRNVSYELAMTWNARYAIYLPDSGAEESGAFDFLWDHVGIEYIEQWLRQRFGPPAKRIEDIYKDLGNWWESVGYYIDYFEDYRS